MKQENLENRLKEAERFVESNQSLVERKIEILKRKGKISPSLETDDLLYLGDLEDLTRNQVVNAILELEEDRKMLGYDTIIGYHASPVDLKVGNSINPTMDGRAYFNDITGLDEMYSKEGTAKFIYEIRADSKTPDDKEMGNVNGGRFYSNSPLLILKKWTVEEFMKDYPKAKFRPY